MEKITFDKLPEAIGLLFARLDSIENLITNNIAAKEVEGDTLLTIKQAGELLNLKVATIYGLVSRAAIPNSKQGKRLYFSKQELTDWIKSGRKLTNAEYQVLAQQYINKNRR